MDAIPEGANVAIYERCSTTEQINSIADQGTNIQQIVRRRKLRVVKTYSDEGISGSTIEERDELNRMIAEVGRLGVSILMVYNISRLTRGGMIDLWELVKRLDDQDVRIFNCQSGMFVDPDDDASALVASVEASQAKASNKQLAKDVTRTMIANVRDRHNVPGSRPPYGYDRLYIDESGKPFQQVRWNEDGTKSILDPETSEVKTTLKKGTGYTKNKAHAVKLVPSTPERVEIARRIFKRAESIGYSGIVDELNVKGIPGPRGGKWNSSTLWDLLKNPAYAGDIAFNQTTKSRYCCIRDGQPTPHPKKKSGTVKFRNNPKEEWIVVPDAHEPLITREQFERVQIAIGTRSHSQIKSGRSKNREYPLSGILRCGYCGEPMQGMCPDGKYRRYICSTRRKHGKNQCVPCSLTANKIETLVLDSVHDHLASECAKSYLRRGLEGIYEGQRRSLGDVETIQRELDQQQKRKNDIFAQLMAAGALDMFKTQIDEMREEEDRLKRRLATAKAELGEKLDKAGFVGQCLELYEDHVLQLKGGCENAIRESLRALGTKVIYHPLKKEGGLEIYPFGHSADG